MVVIGIDFGSESCIVSAVLKNRVEIIVNDYYERKTPSCVAFTDKKRLIGVAAKNQLATNIENTIYGFKELLGNSNKKQGRFELIQTEENPKDVSLCFNVCYRNEPASFTPVQIASFLLGKLKVDTNAVLQSETTAVTGCVIAVPVNFSPSERKALLVAAGIVELNCYYVIKETTSIAINYGFYKKFPSPKTVAFVDFGRSTIQVFVCKFESNKLEVISEVCDLVGGRDIDELLAEHFIKILNDTDLGKKNKSFCAKLLDEVEKLKKKMSLDTIDLILNIKYLLSEEFPLKMRREEMELICAKLFDNVEDVMRRCLSQSGLESTEIDSVEIVGGSTRIPKVKEIIRKVFGKPAVATMNQDEAVSRGCLMRMLLSKLKKDFEIVEKEEFVTVSSDLEEVVPDYNSATFSADESYNDEGDRKSSVEVESNSEIVTKPLTETIVEMEIDESPSISKKIEYFERHEKCPPKAQKSNNQTNYSSDKCPASSLFLKIGQIHENFRGDKDESLDITNDEFVDLLETERKMTDYDKLEDNRKETRNKLDELANKYKDNSAFLMLLNEIERNSFLSKLEYLKNWQDGTTEEYATEIVNLENNIRSCAQRVKAETKPKVNKDVPVQKFNKEIEKVLCNVNDEDDSILKRSTEDSIQSIPEVQNHHNPESFDKEEKNISGFAVQPENIANTSKSSMSYAKATKMSTSCDASSDDQRELACSKSPSKCFSRSFLDIWDKSYDYFKQNKATADLANQVHSFFHKRIHDELLAEEVEIVEEHVIALYDDNNVAENFQRLISLIKELENRTSSILALKATRNFRPTSV